MTPRKKFRSNSPTSFPFTITTSPTSFEKRIKYLQRYNRPIICTEYMARGNGSTFEGSLPIAKKYHVGAINWGLVAGKTQTFLPWDSWKQPYTDREPADLVPRSLPHRRQAL